MNLVFYLQALSWRRSAAWTSFLLFPPSSLWTSSPYWLRFSKSGTWSFHKVLSLSMGLNPLPLPSGSLLTMLLQLQPYTQMCSRKHPGIYMTFIFTIALATYFTCWLCGLVLCRAAVSSDRRYPTYGIRGTEIDIAVCGLKMSMCIWVSEDKRKTGVGLFLVLWSTWHDMN